MNNKMQTWSLALCLSDETNRYQRAVRDDAVLAAQRVGIRLDVFFAEDNVSQQIRQVLDLLNADPSQRPRAIIIMPVRATGSFDRRARQAAESGTGWVCINRTMDSLAKLQAEFPSVPISFVAPDQYETGRIQGRQFRALFPGGCKLLYVQGEATSTSAQGRLKGMKEAISGTNIELAGLLDGNWTEADAERVVTNFLRIVLSGPQRIDLVGCQNDEMAVGALKALSAVAKYLRRPEVLKIPVTGCDGLPDVGQELVGRGQLAATVIMPSTGGPAVELIARALSSGKHPPAEVKLSPVSFPAEQALRPR